MMMTEEAAKLGFMQIAPLGWSLSVQRKLFSHENGSSASDFSKCRDH